MEKSGIRELALQLKADLHWSSFLRSFREPQPGLVAGGGEMLWSESSRTLGVSWWSALCQMPGNRTLFLSLKRLPVGSQN